LRKTSTANVPLPRPHQGKTNDWRKTKKSDSEKKIYRKCELCEGVEKNVAKKIDGSYKPKYGQPHTPPKAVSRQQY
jgi:hypothetical protein